MEAVKPVRWEGPSKEDVSGFPDDVRQDVGHALFLVQRGESPPNGGPLPTVGNGVWEIRADDGDAYRVIYIAKFEEAVYVLHAFEKKSTKGIATPKRHLDRAAKRYKALVARRARDARLGR